MEKQEKMGQDMKKRKWKNANKGITLIALVITIVVLLILARSKYSNVNRGKSEF